VVSARRYIYLDNAAATVPSAEVMLAMQQHQVSYFANPGSIHEPARLAKQRLEQCREGVAKLLNCNSSEVIFSSSGSESNNLAIIGCALANQNRGKHILVSAIEHPSVLRSADRLKSAGFDVEQIPVNSKGLIDKKLLGRLLRDDTILVSVMYANNEIGTIQPIRSLAKLVKSYNSNIVFHTDVCQAVGALKIDTKQLAVDMLSLNGSKIYGPRGVGVLYKNNSVALTPLINGGHQEYGFRAGTENTSAVEGFWVALKSNETMRQQESNRLINLRDEFIATIKSSITGTTLNGHPTKRLPNNINISFADIEGEALLLILDQAGICVSTGSACSSRDLKPSHVLIATGSSAELAHGSIRFSLGRDTTTQDLDYTLGKLIEAVSKLRSITSIGLKVK